MVNEGSLPAVSRWNKKPKRLPKASTKGKRGIRIGVVITTQDFGVINAAGGWKDWLIIEVTPTMPMRRTIERHFAMSDEDDFGNCHKGSSAWWILQTIL